MASVFVSRVVDSRGSSNSFELRLHWDPRHAMQDDLRVTTSQSSLNGTSNTGFGKREQTTLLIDLRGATEEDG